jgi:hypothetical protein
MTQTERIAALQRTVEIQREQIEALTEQIRQLQERLTGWQADPFPVLGAEKRLGHHTGKGGGD